MITRIEQPDIDITTGGDPRTPVFISRRRRWPGVLGAGLLGAAIAAVAVWSIYDHRSLGQKLDATLAAGHEQVQQGVAGLKADASQAAQNSQAATERSAAALGDAGITAAVKTALAADPALSALKIDVSTNAGVVSLSGPAPDEQARERAQVLAAAPQGVVSVDNQLVVVASAGTN